MTSSNVRISQSQLNITQSSIKIYYGLKIWNKIPDEIKHAPSKISFKKRLKSTLLIEYY